MVSTPIITARVATMKSGFHLLLVSWSGRFIPFLVGSPFRNVRRAFKTYLISIGVAQADHPHIIADKWLLHRKSVGRGPFIHQKGIVALQAQFHTQSQLLISAIGWCRCGASSWNIMAASPWTSSTIWFLHLPRYWWHQIRVLLHKNQCRPACAVPK